MKPEIHNLPEMADWLATVEKIATAMGRIQKSMQAITELRGGQGFPSVEEIEELAFKSEAVADLLKKTAEIASQVVQAKDDNAG